MHEDSAHRAGPLIKTVPALAGLIYAAAAAVQFLDATIALGVLDWQFQTDHAMLVSLAALVVAFASSETKNWSNYDAWEQAIIGLAILIMVSHQFVSPVTTGIANNQPLTGAFAFMSGMVAWGVLAR